MKLLLTKCREACRLKISQNSFAINRKYSCSQQLVELINLMDFMKKTFSISGDKSYRDMRTTRQSQSIIISGESGAGLLINSFYISFIIHHFSRKN